jgi:hypothetical protein
LGLILAVPFPFLPLTFNRRPSRSSDHCDPHPFRSGADQLEAGFVQGAAGRVDVINEDQLEAGDVFANLKGVSDVLNPICFLEAGLAFGGSGSTQRLEHGRVQGFSDTLRKNFGLVVTSLEFAQSVQWNWHERIGSPTGGPNASREFRSERDSHRSSICKFQSSSRTFKPATVLAEVNQVAIALRLTGSLETACADADLAGQVIPTQNATGRQEGIDQRSQHKFILREHRTIRG